MLAFLSLVRGHTGLLIGTCLLGAGVLVCGLLALLMHRSGASLRPILWFATLYGLVALPHFINGLYGALQQERSASVSQDGSTAQTDQATQTCEAPQSLRYSGSIETALVENHDALFGPGEAPAQVSDVRQAMAAFIPDAELAPYAVLSTGESVLFARFPTEGKAEQAWRLYLGHAGVSLSGADVLPSRGIAASRLAGDRLFAVVLGRVLCVWTGADDETILARLNASGFTAPAWYRVGGGNDSAHATSEETAKPSPRRIVLLAAGLVAYALLFVFVFFKGAGWASSSSPSVGTVALSEAELVRRLEAINQAEVPFRIERGEAENEFIATWRYADAKWTDLVRVHGMRHNVRIKLRLDSTAGVVRTTDYFSGLDWSAGVDGGSVRWRASLGIVFFHVEDQKVLGLQLNEDGSVKAQSHYSFSFDLNEMKSPLVETVTRAGWTWRPTVWDGPVWLRWLTE